MILLLHRRILSPAPACRFEVGQVPTRRTTPIARIAMTQAVTSTSEPTATWAEAMSAGLRSNTVRIPSVTWIPTRARITKAGLTNAFSPSQPREKSLPPARSPSRTRAPLQRGGQN